MICDPNSDLRKYDAVTQKSFWKAFNYYIKMRFESHYDKDLMSPEFAAIEEILISWDIEDQKDEIKDVFMEAQFFCYTRQKYRKRLGKE